MSHDGHALSPLSSASPVSEADYDVIYAAVMETGRGRWFLSEYARRNRNADTQVLLTTLERIEETIRKERASASFDRIKFDLHEMAKAIVRTKAEIASIGPDGDGKIGGATSELDSIVKATEAATHRVLQAAEKVQELAWTLRERGVEPLACDQLDAHATDIYLACEFQDLTGQRTHKVIQVLRYLEDRINAMVEIWGDDEAPPRAERRHEPQMDQTDIDVVMAPPGPPMPGAFPANPSAGDVIDHEPIGRGTSIPDELADALDGRAQAPSEDMTAVAAMPGLAAMPAALRGDASGVEPNEAAQPMPSAIEAGPIAATEAAAIVAAHADPRIHDGPGAASPSEADGASEAAPWAGLPQAEKLRAVDVVDPDAEMAAAMADAAVAGLTEPLAADEVPPTVEMTAAVSDVSDETEPVERAAEPMLEAAPAVERSEVVESDLAVPEPDATELVATADVAEAAETEPDLSDATEPVAADTAAPLQADAEQLSPFSAELKAALAAAFAHEPTEAEPAAEASALPETGEPAETVPLQSAPAAEAPDDAPFAVVETDLDDIEATAIEDADASAEPAAEAAEAFGFAEPETVATAAALAQDGAAHAAAGDIIGETVEQAAAEPAMEVAPAVATVEATDVLADAGAADEPAGDADALPAPQPAAETEAAVASAIDDGSIEILAADTADHDAHVSLAVGDMAAIEPVAAAAADDGSTTAQSLPADTTAAETPALAAAMERVDEIASEMHALLGNWPPQPTSALAADPSEGEAAADALVPTEPTPTATVAGPDDQADAFSVVDLDSLTEMTFGAEAFADVAAELHDAAVIAAAADLDPDLFDAAETAAVSVDTDASAGDRDVESAHHDVTPAAGVETAADEPMPPLASIAAEIRALLAKWEPESAPAAVEADATALPEAASAAIMAIDIVQAEPDISTAAQVAAPAEGDAARVQDATAGAANTDPDLTDAIAALTHIVEAAPRPPVDALVAEPVALAMDMIEVAVVTAAPPVDAQPIVAEPAAAGDGGKAEDELFEPARPAVLQSEIVLAPADPSATPAADADDMWQPLERVLPDWSESKPAAPARAVEAAFSASAAASFAAMAEIARAGAAAGRPAANSDPLGPLKAMSDEERIALFS